MQNDKTTLKDLSIFTTAGEDIASLIDRTTTGAGREALRQYIRNPPDTYERLLAMQETIRWWRDNPGHWTKIISNGTIVLLEKFFDAADSEAAPPAGLSLVLGSFLQRVLNRNQYTFIQFSLTHFSDFLRGCKELTGLLDDESLPAVLTAELEAMRGELGHPLVPLLLAVNKQTPYATLSRLSFRARRELKNAVFRLLEHYARLDAWQGMGAATADLGWHFPKLLPGRPVNLNATGLYHPLLPTPVPYDISFDGQRHFLLLTGANMSGKTTFMRALGVGALLAHLGMGVPAAGMEISFLQGIITNMHVEDNLLRGESYFFAEVQRMKGTAQKISGDLPHLVLMDELFKGTNVHDAYECTRAVVEGLLRHPHHLMILSTHIHEVAHHFEARSDVLFAYFVTTMGDDGSFRFTYELRPGISNDRIGYRILLQEGVIELLGNS
jgi:DNA mismatch repair ATPase MutS